MSAKIINIQKRVAEKNFDINKEPCGRCPVWKKAECYKTCDKASHWFEILATKFTKGAI